MCVNNEQLIFSIGTICKILHTTSRGRSVFLHWQVYIQTQVGMHIFYVVFFTFLININKIPNQLICNNEVTVTFKHKSSLLLLSFHPLLHCKVFVVGKGCNTVFHCPALKWLLMSRATLLIYMDSSGMALWIWIQSLSQCWKYVPHPSFDESHLISSSKKLWKEAFSCYVSVSVGDYVKDERKDGVCIYSWSLFSVSSSSDRLDSGGLVFWLSTAAAAVDAGQHDQEEERGWKERQEGQTEDTGG